MFLYTSFKKNWKKLNIRDKVKKKKLAFSLILLEIWKKKKLQCRQSTTWGKYTSAQTAVDTKLTSSRTSNCFRFDLSIPPPSKLLIISLCVCIDRIVPTAVKAYYFQSSLPLPCLRLKLHTYSNTQKIYLVSALCGTEHITVLLWQLIRNSYIHEGYISCASLWQSHINTKFGRCSWQSNITSDKYVHFKWNPSLCNIKTVVFFKV